MSRRMLRIQWISTGSALALLAAASLTGGLLLQQAGNSAGESLVLLAELLAAFSVASFVVLAVSLKRWRPRAATGAPNKRSTPTRTVSKLSRYIRGIFQGSGAFVLLIVGLLVLARGSKAGIVVIAIGIAFGVAALANFWLAERTSRAGATARSAERR